MKRVERWWSDRVQQDVTVARWGEVGAPVLLFPTAGGDAEECERFGLIGALEPLLAAGRVKVYSIDSIAGRTWLRREDPGHAAWLQNAFDAVIAEEVLPFIRADCHDPAIEVVTAGASIGAFNAVATLCRHADAFRLAIGMSGTYDLTPWLGGYWSDDFYYSSPLHYLAGLGDDHPQLANLRRRFVVLAAGRGRWEEPAETWKMAHALGSRGVPNRVDLWSEQHDHDWPTWREMLPLYLDSAVAR